MADIQALCALCNPLSAVPILVARRPATSVQEPQVTRNALNLMEVREIEFRNGLTFYISLAFYSTLPFL